MWTFLLPSNSRDGSAEPNFKLLFRARRRRRRMTAGVEALESRAMLSATGAELSVETISMPDPKDSESSLAVEVMSDSGSEQDGTSDVTHRGSLDLLWSSDSISESFASVGDAGFPMYSLAASESAPALASTISPLQRVSSSDRVGFSSSFFGSLANNDRSPVELRIAETGQVVFVGAAAPIQDSRGLTVIDDHSPTTYLQTTDSEGRTQSRLVFVSRAARLGFDAQPVASADESGVIVADADSTNGSLSQSELAARPDLHDFETALDAATTESSDVSPSVSPKDAAMNFAATSRTRWIGTKQTASMNTSSHRADTSASNDTQFIRDVNSIRTTDDLDSSETTAFPIFDPTTRNVVLSVCLIGSLARATARRRRRQKAAFVA